MDRYHMFSSVLAWNMIILITLMIRDDAMPVARVGG